MIFKAEGYAVLNMHLDVLKKPVKKLYKKQGYDYAEFKTLVRKIFSAEKLPDGSYSVDLDLQDKSILQRLLVSYIAKLRQGMDKNDKVQNDQLGKLENVYKKIRI